MKSFTNKKGVVYQYDPWTKLVNNPKTGKTMSLNYSAKLINEHAKQLGLVEKVHNRKTFLGNSPTKMGPPSRTIPFLKDRRVYQLEDKNGNIVYKYANNMRKVKQNIVNRIEQDQIFNKTNTLNHALDVISNFHDKLHSKSFGFNMNKSKLGYKINYRDGRSETFMNTALLTKYASKINNVLGFFDEEFVPNSDLINLEDTLTDEDWEAMFNKQRKQSGYQGVDVFLTKISQVSSFDIIDFRDGKEELVSRYKTGFFFDKYNPFDCDLSLFQIYTKDQFKSIVTDKTKKNIEDCFLYALRQYGYKDSDFAKIYIRMTPPFSSRKMIPVISEILNCYFVVRRTKENKKTDSYIIPKKWSTQKSRDEYEKEHGVTLKKLIMGEIDNHWFADDPELYTEDIKNLLLKYKNRTFYSFLCSHIDLFDEELQSNLQFYLQAEKLNKKYELDFDKITPDIEADSYPSLSKSELIEKYKTIDNILYLNEITQKIDGKQQTRYGFFYNNKLKVSKMPLYKALAKTYAYAKKNNMIVVYRGIKDNEKLLSFIKENNASKIFFKNTDKGIYKKRNIDTSLFYFADFETITQNSRGKEIPHQFALGCISSMHSDEVHTFDDLDKFLDFIPNNSKVFFHNLKYDAQQFISNNNVTIQDRLMVSGSMLSSRITYFEKTIYLQDTYKMISSPLSEFPKMFNLDVKKEAISFTLYNKLHWKKQKYVSLPKFYKHVKESNCDQKLVDDFTFYQQKDGTYSKTRDRRYNVPSIDYDAYMRYYCQQDVNVLKQGWVTFRKWISEVFDLDVACYFTIGSLSISVFEKQGCFIDVFQLGGISKAYARSALIGGRTMSLDNKKLHIQEPLVAIDATSLYPTSMRYNLGHIKGKPTFYRNDGTSSLQDKLNSCTYYIGYFKITKYPTEGTYLDQPILSYKNEDDTRMFVNDLPIDVVYIDKQTYEDAVNFQGYEFECKHAMIWNDGWNTKIHPTIQNMFDTRLEKKRENNKIQTVFKLVMNSGYGKYSPKDIKTEQKTFKNYKPLLESLQMSRGDLDDFDFDKLIDYKDHSKYKVLCYIVKLKSQQESFVGHSFYRITHIEETKYYTHYTLRKNALSESKNANYPHLATYCLSYSKHIMNRVVKACKDTDVTIYYGDTDSIHVAAKNVDKLYTHYKETYDRDLTPKTEALGGFTSDYELTSINRKISENQPFINESIKNMLPINMQDNEVFNGWCIDAYFFGKKCYCEKLILREPNKDNSYDWYESINFHLKGVPKTCIEFKALQYNPDSLFDGCLDLAQEFDQGNEVTFDLTERQKGVCMNFDNDQVQNYEKGVFTRKLSFQ